MEDKKVGFSTTPQDQGRDSGNYYDIIIPEDTSKSLELEDKDLVHVELRNMRGETEEFNREVNNVRDSEFKFYVPKPVVESLKLNSESLVDVFISNPD